MIVVDTSALIAIIKREPLGEACIERLLSADVAMIGAPSVAELQLVMLKQRGPAGVEEAQALVAVTDTRIVPWTAELLVHSLDAARRYRGAPAHLNFGDCLSYALAKSLDVPLLYVGGDFAATDIRPALP